MTPPVDKALLRQVLAALDDDGDGEIPWPKCQYEVIPDDDDGDEPGGWCGKHVLSATAPIYLCADHVEQAAALLFEVAILTPYGRDLLARAQAAGETSARAIAASKATGRDDDGLEAGR